MVAGVLVYHDDQSMFICNTKIPGCKNVCYDVFSLLLYARFLVFQIVMINTPLVYLAMHKIAFLDDDGHGHKKEKETDRRKKHDGQSVMA